MTTAGVLACLRPNLTKAVESDRVATAISTSSSSSASWFVMKPGEEVGQRHDPLARRAGKRQLGVEGQQGDGDVAARWRREQVAADRSHVPDRPAGRAPRGGAEHRDRVLVGELAERRGRADRAARRPAALEPVEARPAQAHHDLAAARCPR